MKFGRNLPQNKVPEWALSYVDYKGLKKLIGSAAHQAKADAKPDLAGLLHSLDRNLEKVDAFYNGKLAQCSRQWGLLCGRWEEHITSMSSLDEDDLHTLVAALLDLAAQLRKLQWYGEVNRQAFTKITKKSEKRLLGVFSQREYLMSRVDPKAFANGADLTMLVAAVSSLYSKIPASHPQKKDGSSDPSPEAQPTVPRTTQDKQEEDLDDIVEAIRGDNATLLLELLSKAENRSQENDEPSVPSKLLNRLLQRSISHRSYSCLDLILGRSSNLADENDINSQNCIHRLVLAACRTDFPDPENGSPRTSSIAERRLRSHIPPAMAPSLALSCSHREFDRLEGSPEQKAIVHTLQFMLSKLRPHQQISLIAKDVYGRTPLHYAAENGLVEVCRLICRYMKLWKSCAAVQGVDTEYWQDVDGCSPLRLSVLGGHPMTTKLLLISEDENDEELSQGSKPAFKSAELLHLATLFNYVMIAQLLIDGGVNINHQDEQGETALHIAARYGHQDCAKLLLQGTSLQRADTETAELTFAWTPMFTACAGGHLGVVELLLDAGAQADKTDSSGWTPKEHAAFRGNILIVRRLDEATEAALRRTGLVGDIARAEFKPAPDDKILSALQSGTISDRGFKPVKRFGHKYLNGESLVLINLGTKDPRKAIEPVKLDRVAFASAHNTLLDQAVSVVVSAPGASGEPSTIDLPVQGDISVEPIFFTTADASQLTIYFDIVSTATGPKNEVIGRGIALLSSITPSLGAKRGSLHDDVSVPVLAANTLDLIGSVTFNVLVVKPFVHPNMSITESQTYWKTVRSTTLIGHRGLGKNQPSLKSLQLGENTIQSFITAANLGASYVEFDVQLTKDNVPVIYHDFLVSETGIDVPMHALTLEQFLHISRNQTPRPSRPPSPVPAAKGRNGEESGPRQRYRSLSVSQFQPELASDMMERMKCTRTLKTKGFKANSRGSFIQAPFTTLEEMFKTLPESTGFNIEIKYPMLYESEQEDMDPYAVELNIFVDSILRTVYDFIKGRKVVFSSFHPDVCLLLSLKQPSIPVLFLTDAGLFPTSDIRGTSLQEAVRFASRWNLLGIVTVVEPLIRCPRLVRVIKESGLVCASYGALNNVPENVQVQVREGIDAVIVDNVLAIRRGLTASSPHSSSPTEAVNGATSGVTTL